MLGHIQHTQGACVGADAQLAAVQGDVNLRHTALVLGLKEKVGEVQGPQAKLVVFCSGHGITVNAESRKSSTQMLITINVASVLGTLTTRHGNFKKDHTAEEIKNKVVHLPRVDAQGADAAGMQLISAKDLVGGAVHSQY